MDEPQKPKLPIWPFLFIGAFALGAILWVAWMAVIVKKTLQIHPDEMSAPARAGNAAAASNRPPVLTNLPATNSAPAPLK